MIEMVLETARSKRAPSIIQPVFALSAEYSTFTTMSLDENFIARIASAYDAACSSSRDPVGDEGGGFLVADSLAGGFLPESEFHREEGASQGMKVSALPKALESLELDSSQRQNISELLEANSVHENYHDEPHIPKMYFIEAVQTVMEGVRRSKRRRTTRRTSNESYDLESNSSDQYNPSTDETMSSSEEENPAKSNQTKLTKTKRDQARFLYRLLLERIPLVAPTMLSSLSNTGIRTDVSEEEVNTRHIGIDELRFAARNLGETPSTAELAEMLHEASLLSSGTKAHTNTQAPRIGLHEYVH